MSETDSVLATDSYLSSVWVYFCCCRFTTRSLCVLGGARSCNTGRYK